MISRTIAVDGVATTVTFTLTDPALKGRSVCVVGDFNDWDPGALPLALRGDGNLVATIDLRPAAYRFRYLSEFGWFNDPTADTFEDNAFGDTDCILDLTGA